MNAPASRLHQKILGNILMALGAYARQPKARWEVLPGIGARISDIANPLSNLLIRQNDDLEGAKCDDILVAIEILSPSTANHDLRWKRKAYATLPSLSQYVVVAQDAVEIVSYDRANGLASAGSNRPTPSSTSRSSARASRCGTSTATRASAFRLMAKPDGPLAGARLVAARSPPHLPGQRRLP